MNLEELLQKHEGYRQFPYHDTQGILTIGIGRNLEAVGIRENEARYLLREDIAQAQSALVDRLPDNLWQFLNNVRRAVLISMAFNLGINGLFRFRKMFQALEQHDFDTAALEMLDSRWAAQVGNRARELSRMMQTGKWE